MSQELATKSSVKLLFEREDVKSKFQEMLGKKSAGFIVSLISVVEGNELLKSADRDSILFAAATAASLDLPINPNLGFAYIVPYKNKDGVRVAQFQMGYKGFIQLAMRSGQFKTISATPIYEGQLVEENPLTGYKFDFTIKSDKVIGYAGYFELVNGFSKVLYMSLTEMKNHGLQYSQNFKKYNTGLWKDDFDAMAQKTVLKLLLSKYAPLSIEMQKAQLADQAVIKDWEAQEPEYIDNEPVDEEKTAEEKLNDEVLKQAKAMSEEEDK